MLLDTRHGAQGQLDRASKSMLENEYGTSKEDEVVAKILEKGDVQEVSVCFKISELSTALFDYSTDTQDQ